MAFSRGWAACFLLFLVLVVASEMGTTKVVEARTCGSASETYNGTCLGEEDTECSKSCSNEGFEYGGCIPNSEGVGSTGLRCICRKNCTCWA